MANNTLTASTGGTYTQLEGEDAVKTPKSTGLRLIVQSVSMQFSTYHGMYPMQTKKEEDGSRTHF